MFGTYRRDRQQFQVRAIDLDGGDSIFLRNYTGSNGYLTRLFVVAPDGFGVATVDGETAREEIVLTDIHGESRRVVATNPLGHHDAPAWSHDSRRIAYAAVYRPAGLSLRADIYVVNVDDLSTQQLTDSRAYDSLPTWSP